MGKRRPEMGAMTVRRETTELSQYSGPLPAPLDFAGYNEVLPGAAERILAMAEQEQRNRHANESRLVTAAVVSTYIGQGAAALLGVGVCGGGIAAILHGSPTAGAVAILSALASLVTTFVYKAKKDDEKPPQKS